VDNEAITKKMFDAAVEVIKNQEYRPDLHYRFKDRNFPPEMPTLEEKNKFIEEMRKYKWR
jgi:hypothetical protein